MSIDLFPSQALTVLPPSGVWGQTQYNNAGVLAGSSGLTLSATQVTGITYADQAAGRTALGLGTLAVQNAGAVAITGGTATLTGATQLNGSVGVQGAGSAFVATKIFHLKASQHGLQIAPTDTDAAGAKTISFLAVNQSEIGSITTTATATAYNTSSDVRLKEFVQTLVGALDVVRALRPVSFHWQADGSRGNGFLAHELMQIVPEAVTGLPDEVNPDGTIKPQQVDHSRLLPWAIAGMKELLTMVEGLQARVTALEESLGL